MGFLNVRYPRPVPRLFRSSLLLIAICLLIIGNCLTRMSQPGEDRRTRSQSRALSFTTPGGDFETSTSPTRTEVMTDFVQAEERRAQREEARVQREEERRQEDQKRYEDERRFAQEQQ